MKLNQNESPFDLPPEEWALLAEELKAVPLNRYPDPEHQALRQSIAASAGAAPDMVVVAAGANALIELLIRWACGPGDQVLTVSPTYHLYGRFASMNRAELIDIPWGPSFVLPVAELLGAVGPRARLLLLCRPNNPTGHLFPAGPVLELAERFPGVVAVDEAYFDFCRDTLAPFVGDAPNLVVVRTMSKAYGAAGLRVGYALAPPAIAGSLRDLQAPYGLGGLTQVTATFLLRRPHIMERHRGAILANRDDLARRLGEVPGATALPSATNFLLVRTDCSADALDRYLRDRRILVRNVRWEDRHIRVSVGTPDEHAELAAAMRAFHGERDAEQGT